MRKFNKVPKEIREVGESNKEKNKLAPILGIGLRLKSILGKDIPILIEIKIEKLARPLTGVLVKLKLEKLP